MKITKPQSITTKLAITAAIVVIPYISNARPFGKEDIVKMCQTAAKPTSFSQQFDGKQANVKVLQMKAGKYSYPQGGALLLYKKGYYLLKLPQDGRSTTYGTDGDDLLAHGGIVGGCSLAQLSEAMQKNKLNVKNFKLIKPY